MKGEDKMNRTIIRIGIAVGLLIGFGQNIKAQRPSGLIRKLSDQQKEFLTQFL